MEKLTNYLTLFTSSGTLICCALPALFVTLGAGSVFASLINLFPALLWFSINKIALFIFTGVMLLVGGLLQYNARKKPCPLDIKQLEACNHARKISSRLYLASLLIYLVGGFFAFIAPHLI